MPHTDTSHSSVIASTILPQRFAREQRKQSAEGFFVTDLTPNLPQGSKSFQIDSGSNRERAPRFYGTKNESDVDDIPTVVISTAVGAMRVQAFECQGRAFIRTDDTSVRDLEQATRSIGEIPNSMRWNAIIIRDERGNFEVMFSVNNVDSAREVRDLLKKAFPRQKVELVRAKEIFDPDLAIRIPRF